jgi:hypothetical protein
MRAIHSFGVASACIALLGATASVAEPGLEVNHAVARVTIIPEDRPDVAITVIKTNKTFPLTINRMGDQVIVEGNLGWRSANCNSFFGRPRIGAFGIGSVSYDDMPQIVVRTPRQVQVKASGAVFGSIGRGAGVDLSNAGCGDWTVGHQSGPLRASLAGSGDLRAGDSTLADLRVAGSADTVLRTARDGLTAHISGSGEINADEVNGPLHVKVTGSGDVKVRGGAVSDMVAVVAGSGDVTFGGVAQSLDASIAGSGDVSAAKVTGSVTKHVAGSGDVNVGR